MKLVLFDLLPGDEDESITGGAFKGQRGFTRDQRGAVVGVDAPAAVEPDPNGLHRAANLKWRSGGRP